VIRQNSSALNGLHSLLRKKLPPLDRGKRRIIILVEKFLGGPKNNQLLNATQLSAEKNKRRGVTNKNERG